MFYKADHGILGTVIIVDMQRIFWDSLKAEPATFVDELNVAMR